MKPPSLRMKFALLALLNVSLLGAVFLLFARHQLGQEFQSFLMSTAREKIVAVSRQLSLDLAGVEGAQRDVVLGRYAAMYGVEFRLYDSDGARLAGPDSTLPAEVAGRLVRPAGPPPR